jgi:uncharacterized protein YeaO (DUF488 family)
VESPFTAETAHRLTSGPLLAAAGHLDRLVETSLLRASQRDGRTWYRLWHTVRAHVRRPGSVRTLPSHGARFTREGAIWALAYAGRTTLVADSKGMRDLSVLLARPGGETHCSTLIGAGVTEGDLGTVLDDEARRSYRRRAEELRADLDEACRNRGSVGRRRDRKVVRPMSCQRRQAYRGIRGNARRGSRMAGGGVRVRRVYEEPADGDGTRVLVDRLWPRGLSKAAARLDEWCKDVAPSPELRRWYGHAPERFAEFGRRYRAELEAPERVRALAHLRDLAGEGTLTLLTATRRPELSEAAVLAGLLRARDA